MEGQAGRASRFRRQTVAAREREDCPYQMWVAQRLGSPMCTNEEPYLVRGVLTQLRDLYLWLLENRCRE